MTVAAASQYERTNLYILCPANNWLFSQRTSLHVREEKYICLYYIDTTISKSQNKQTLFYNSLLIIFNSWKLQLLMES